jgi:hypothetical protein
MAAGLKVLTFSGSEKGTRIYFTFLSEIPGKRIPSRFPNRAPVEIPAYRAFYISLDISLYLKGLKKRASVHVPHKWGPCGNRCPLQSLI